MRYAEAQLKHAGARGTKGGRDAACDGCSHVGLQLIFRDGAVEGLKAALYAVLELSIPLRKLGNYFVWTRRSVPRRNTLAEAHHVPGDEAMLSYVRAIVSL